MLDYTAKGIKVANQLNLKVGYFWIIWWDKCNRGPWSARGKQQKESEELCKNDERCNDAVLEGTRRGPWVKEGGSDLQILTPSFWHQVVLWKTNFPWTEVGGDGFGIILMSSLQPRSFSCTVLSRVPTPIRIYCCHWSYRRWNSGANERWESL